MRMVLNAGYAVLRDGCIIAVFEYQHYALEFLEGRRKMHPEVTYTFRSLVDKALVVETYR